MIDDFIPSTILWLSIYYFDNFFLFKIMINGIYYLEA